MCREEATDFRPAAETILGVCEQSSISFPDRLSLGLLLTFSFEPGHAGSFNGGVQRNLEDACIAYLNGSHIVFKLKKLKFLYEYSLLAATLATSLLPHLVHSTPTGGRDRFSQGTSNCALPRLKTDMLCRPRTAVGAVMLSRAPCLASNSVAVPREGVPLAGMRPCNAPHAMKLRFHQTCLSSTGQRRFVGFVLLFRCKGLLP